MCHLGNERRFNCSASLPCEAARCVEQDTDHVVLRLRFHHFQSSIEFMPAGRATDAIGFDRKFV